MTDLPDERLGGELDDEGAARVQGGPRPRVRDRLGHQVPRRARAVRRQPIQPARRRRRGPPLLPVYQLQAGARISGHGSMMRNLKQLTARRTMRMGQHDMLPFHNALRLVFCQRSRHALQYFGERKRLSNHTSLERVSRLQQRAART